MSSNQPPFDISRMTPQQLQELENQVQIQRQQQLQQQQQQQSQSPGPLVPMGQPQYLQNQQMQQYPPMPQYIPPNQQLYQPNMQPQYQFQHTTNQQRNEFMTLNSRQRVDEMANSLVGLTQLHLFDAVAGQTNRQLGNVPAPQFQPTYNPHNSYNPGPSALPEAPNPGITNNSNNNTSAIEENRGRSRVGGRGPPINLDRGNRRTATPIEEVTESTNTGASAPPNAPSAATIPPHARNNTPAPRANTNPVKASNPIKSAQSSSGAPGNGRGSGPPQKSRPTFASVLGRGAGRGVANPDLTIPKSSQTQSKSKSIINSAMEAIRKMKFPYASKFIFHAKLTIIESNQHQKLEKEFGLFALCARCWAMGLKCDHKFPCKFCKEANAMCEFAFCQRTDCERQNCIHLHTYETQDEVLYEATLHFIKFADKLGIRIQIYQDIYGRPFPDLKEGMPQSYLMPNPKPEDARLGFTQMLTPEQMEKWQPAMFLAYLIDNNFSSEDIQRQRTIVELPANPRGRYQLNALPEGQHEDNMAVWEAIWSGQETVPEVEESKAVSPPANPNLKDASVHEHLVGLRPVGNWADEMDASAPSVYTSTAYANLSSQQLEIQESGSVNSDAPAATHDGGEGEEAVAADATGPTEGTDASSRATTE